MQNKVSSLFFNHTRSLPKQRSKIRHWKISKKVALVVALKQKLDIPEKCSDFQRQMCFWKSLVRHRSCSLQPKSTSFPFQWQCIGSWAFSATGSLEGQHTRQTGELVSLSEQQLIDCSVSFGNRGCASGSPVDAFEFVIANGLVTEEDYPYKAKVRTKGLLQKQAYG